MGWSEGVLEFRALIAAFGGSDLASMIPRVHGHDREEAKRFGDVWRALQKAGFFIREWKYIVRGVVNRSTLSEAPHAKFNVGTFNVYRALADYSRA
jgi:hypothetical protein